ncbi:DNA-directed RNA polymerase subunit alpha [Patescibacteria group bacterium]|nr:DNA-directed RNA polymerase subunit alpha [Patescibacteria group bacterium]
MENISLPDTISAKKIEDDRAEITISPCYPGYGTTVGNALRRVLMSSLPGGAATAVKIKGADHEFSTLDNIKEDVVDIILNLKQLRFIVHSDEPVEITLKAKGEKEITGADVEKNAQVEVINKKLKIATQTDPKAEFEMTLIVQKGRGYVPVELREKEKLEIGYIAIDAVYTPVKNVNFNTEHVRVEEMTNYDKLILDVTTDGSMSPEEALEQASDILVEQFSHIKTNITSEEPEAKKKKAKKAKKEDEETEETEETEEVEVEVEIEVDKKEAKEEKEVVEDEKDEKDDKEEKK